MRIASALLAAGLTVAAGPPASAAPAPREATQTIAAFYSFDTAVPGATGTVADVSNHGRTMRIRAADGGAVRFFERAPKLALLFPARCVPRAATCARAMLETPHHESLNPGTRRLFFGARLIGTAGAVGTGANILQKGVNPGGSQYKLQIGARGKPNCVVAGQAAGEVFLARSSAPVTDGAWHQVACLRTGTTLYVYVDGVARGSTAVPATVTVTNTLPLRLGARNLADRTDRFGGGVDDVFVTIGG
ncbi:LamG domain-containing protein [Pilimelia terevasa]|nr:LamG domain-containing protein [Pilimelia terevasa]